MQEWQEPSHLRVRRAVSQYDLEPQDQAYLEGEADDREVTGVRVVLLFGETPLRRLFVIAERTENPLPGRTRRLLNQQFTESERRLLGRWRTRIRGWYLLTGIPRRGVRMTAQTYATLSRFADFFASV